MNTDSKPTRWTMIMLILVLTGCAEKPAPIDSPYLNRVVAYADAMIEYSRDDYGDRSPLFASALDRNSRRINRALDTVAVGGVRETDRALTGANPLHDVALYKLLYDLSVETGNNTYESEADKAMRYFFTSCQSEVTDFFCWGEHLFWDFEGDSCGFTPGVDYHEGNVWPFWGKAYQFAPEAAWRYTLAEWEHQIHDKSTGDFSRHARYTRHETFSGYDFPRYAGQLMERWAYSYGRPENSSRPEREELRRYIAIMFDRMKDNMAQSASGLLIAGRTAKGDHNQVVWLTSNLELARCLEVAADIMEPKVAEEMRAFALKQDADFMNAPHRLDSAGGGFAVTLHAETGLPRVRSMNRPYSSTWSSGYGYGTHAGVANTLVGRHSQLLTSSPEVATEYREMVLTIGEEYLSSQPNNNHLLKPNEFAQVIELMLNCYGLSKDQRYLQRAAYFADVGISLFFDEQSMLPKATNQHDHYESITGGPDFMYQLLALHQALQE